MAKDNFEQYNNAHFGSNVDRLGGSKSKSVNLQPMDKINGFDVRPGFYDVNGATAIPCGVNFTIHSHGATSIELLLFHRGENKPYAVIPFPLHYRMGKVYSMIVFDLEIEDFEYAFRVDGPYDKEKGLIFDKSKYLLDPYAKVVTGHDKWGNPEDKVPFYKSKVVKNNFDWGDTRQPLIPDEDLIIYELHVRGFTKDKSSGVSYPGTFKGLIDKIPYLVELGVNVVELMPVFEFDEMLDAREYEGETLCNYWGYSTVGFFAPNNSYAAFPEENFEGSELKELVRALNENGIEVFLDVVFNHTAEGDNNGPFFSFKGIDNSVYYLLNEEGEYMNYSGCGNSVNCNHPTVQRMIIDCLRYWVTTYHIDGFRFDLASILGRNEDGRPMQRPPLVRSLAFDTILGDSKLIAEAWDAAGLYQVGSFPSWNRWSEWNGRYRDDIRKFLKGDFGTANAAAERIAGSHDIYDPINRQNASVNFITCHDGFTLNDMFSYNEKHNLKNGWNNTDGANDNNSWNCGVEGETDDIEINTLRKRMVKNAITILLCSRGIPMFLAGDEFCNTQFGNNNAYCQDNEISWLDWSNLDKNRDVFEFFKKMIAFRKDHQIMRKNISDGAGGYRDISFHGTKPNVQNFNDHDRYIGVMFAGEYPDKTQDYIYLAANSYWESLEIELPKLPQGMQWVLVSSTFADDDYLEYNAMKKMEIQANTVAVFMATVIGG